VVSGRPFNGVLIDVRAEACTFPRAGGGVAGVKAAGAGGNMKIYLLMVLIGTLLTMIRFTSVPEQQSKTLPKS
jgi:hypothetical protein